MLRTTLDCICNRDQVLMSYAAVIARRIRQTQIEIGMELIEKSGLLQEFSEFYEKRNKTNILIGIEEFAKLHPDKFYVPDQTESYGHFKWFKNIK